MNRVDRPVSEQRSIDRAVRTAQIGDRVSAEGGLWFLVVSPSTGELYVTARREHAGGTTGNDRMLFAWQIERFEEPTSQRRLL